MDRLSPERRSWLMSQVKAKNTKPEIAVRKLIYASGFRYRLHVDNLPGKPDIVFHGRKKIIFVHGCFWHGHTGCKYARLPKQRVEFWSQKIGRNRERDSKTIGELEKKGWRVLVVWQCELKKPELLAEEIKNFLQP
ncbi:very short patch repair endonuclease [Massilia rhizosphaerae]|uniref:very short patch repair endonuclease n=1 Tax=Massilia rhizosphaerae TaxID=2784389 RepID=UPI0018DD4D84|nr:very short patch repair endonuclease [Massilia rhizosphaerae]